MTGEKVLIDGCVKNDRACQQELYSRYCRKMLMVCQRYTRTMVDAEDILQEGFIKVFGHISSFKGAAKLETWMTRIFINSALNHRISGKKSIDRGGGERIGQKTERCD